MALFNYKPEGVKLHSGTESKHIIDCESLTDDDLMCLAESVKDELGQFKWIMPVMRGGLRFFSVLAPMVYSPHANGCFLVVDDVWTTGASMLEAIFSLGKQYKKPNIHCVVLFARSETPDWVTVASGPWFSVPKEQGSD